LAGVIVAIIGFSLVCLSKKKIARGCSSGFNLQDAAYSNGSGRNFVREGPVTWRTSNCSLRLFSNSWNWHKYQWKIFASFLGQAPCPRQPHSGYAAGLDLEI